MDAFCGLYPPSPSLRASLRSQAWYRSSLLPSHTGNQIKTMAAVTTMWGNICDLGGEAEGPVDLAEGLDVFGIADTSLKLSGA